jgi:hypothetical protein
LFIDSPKAALQAAEESGGVDNRSGPDIRGFGPAASRVESTPGI